MALNLHSEVRGAITSVNPDIAATYRSSGGYTTDAAGNRTPTLVDTAVTIQVQALSAKDLRQLDYLNIEGVQRSVYMFGNTQGVDRPDLKGGDLLVFKQTVGSLLSQTWLVVGVLETWTPDLPGWCKLAIVLQTDAGV